jgi:hypothetical protein
MTAADRYPVSLWMTPLPGCSKSRQLSPCPLMHGSSRNRVRRLSGWN